jgi:hypothetical protein
VSGCDSDFRSEGQKVGRTKELIFEIEAERQQKEDALLKTPELIEASNRRIDDLRDEVDELHSKFTDSQSWKS